MNTVLQKIRDKFVIKLWFLKFDIQSVYHYMGTERSNDQLIEIRTIIIEDLDYLRRSL